MKIAAYIHTKYAKENYAHESHNVRAWPGFNMILDVMTRNGIDYQYAGIATVHNYDVVLVSITSDCDWWTFLGERLKWKVGKYKIIVGGAGVLNVLPFLEFVDCFVFGRGENIIIPLLESLKDGEQYKHDSVCWSNSFDINNIYKINQTDILYPEEYRLDNGKRYKESSVGCPNKCYFCGYTWQRKYIGDGTYTAGSGTMGAGNVEHTLKDLLSIPTEQWQASGPLRIVGLDGMSERLRFSANKKISREMLVEFYTRLATIKPPHQVKIYCIVGYPSETTDDWRESINDIAKADNKLLSDKQWSLLFHFTPFRAMPATPAACWPMTYKEHRGVIARTLKKEGMPGNVFYQGKRFWAVESLGTDPLDAVVKSAIILRGDQTDSANIVKISLSSKFKAASSYEKRKTLEQLFDTDKLFGAYNPDTLPTRYLQTYVKINHKEPPCLNIAS